MATSPISISYWRRRFKELRHLRNYSILKWRKSRFMVSAAISWLITSEKKERFSYIASEKSCSQDNFAHWTDPRVYSQLSQIWYITECISNLRTVSTWYERFPHSYLQMQQKSNHWSEENFSPFIHWISDIVFDFCKGPYFKNDITEIQWIFGLNFFRTSALTESKILFSHCG